MWILFDGYQFTTTIQNHFGRNIYRWQVSPITGKAKPLTQKPTLDYLLPFLDQERHTQVPIPRTEKDIKVHDLKTLLELTEEEYQKARSTPATLDDDYAVEEEFEEWDGLFAYCWFAYPKSLVPTTAYESQLRCDETMDESEEEEEDSASTMEIDDPNENWDFILRCDAVPECELTAWLNDNQRDPIVDLREETPTLPKPDFSFLDDLDFMKSE